MQISLSSRISWGISLLVLLLIAALAAASLSYFERELRNTVVSQQMNLLENLSQELDRQLVTARDLIDGLAQTAGAEDFASSQNAREFIEQNPGLREVFRHGIHLLDPQGHLLATLSRPPLLDNAQFAGSELLAPLLKHRRPYIAPPIVVSGLPLLQVGAPAIAANGELLGYVIGSDYLLSDRLLGRLNSIDVGRSGYLYLFDRQGTILAHPDFARILQPVNGISPELLEQVLGGFSGAEISGKADQQALLGFKHLTRVNWVLASHYPTAEAFAGQAQARRLLISEIVLLTLLFLLALWLLLRQLAAPLKQFTEEVRAVSRGEAQLLSLPKQSTSELTTLGQAFNQLLGDLQARTASLHEQQSLMESLLNNTAIACFALDPQHRVLLWNRACEQLTGVPASRLLGTQRHWSAFYPQQRPCLSDLVINPGLGELENLYESSAASSLTPGGYQAEGWYLGLGGRDRYLLVNAVPVQRADGQLLAVIETIEEITELRRAHEDMQQTLSLLDATLEATADGIVVENRAGRIIRYNQRAAEMWKMREPLQKTSDLQDLSQRILAQLTDPTGYQQRIREIIREPEQEFFDVIEFRDGRCFERISRPQLLNGQIVGRVWSFHDITEQSRLAQNLRQAQKMEAVGQLAGGIAHDFNNLLTVINGYSDVLVNSLEDHPQWRRHAELVLQAGQRAADLTGQLLAFSRRQLLRPQVIALNELIRKNQKLLGHLLREDMQLQLQLEEVLPSIRIDPNQMEQILINLVVNARDAMGSGGRLLLLTCCAQLDDKFVEAHPGARTGAFVRLSVADNGSGMSEEVRQRIFEPFFTTKERGKGTGLGLATVYGIVKQSGGYICVDSAPQEGTSFDIYLPVVDEPLPVAQLPQATPRRGNERVLVVENEAGLRELVVAALQRQGYQAVGVASGEQALELLEGSGAEFDLLLSDIVMAGMTGMELATLLQRREPHLKVLLMTGYADHQELGLAEAPAFPLLQKPFLPADLLRRVQGVLGDSQDS